MTTTQTSSKSSDARAFAVEAARLMHDSHCENITIIDVRGISQVCDYVIIGTGTSDRQMRSVAAELEELGEQSNHPPFRASADSDATWVVVDFVDVVAHLFEPQRRLYYDLEALWADGPRIEWQRPAGSKPAPGLRRRSGDG